MNCNKCGRDNRPVAKYCKWCGTALAASQSQQSGGAPAGGVLDRLVGKDELVKWLGDLIASAKNVAAQGRNGGIDMRLDMSFARTGPP